MVKKFSKEVSSDFMKSVLTPFLPNMEHDLLNQLTIVTKDKDTFVIEYSVQEGGVDA